jgi:hypothetical protein
LLLAVRDKAKMEAMAEALEFPKGSYTIREVDLRSLTSVRNFCKGLTSPIG